MVEKTEVEKKPHSVPFLFNLWERDERFWKIDSNPVIAGMARQLLGSEEVVLMEDGAVIKKPVVGGKLAWHQDYAYWPLASPGAVTCWIALDDVGAENGGDAGRRRARTSSARSSRSSSATAARSCTTSGPASSEVRPPEEAGLEVVGYELKAGECGFHHALLWHASGPEHEPEPAPRLHPALRRGRDDVARRASLPLQLHRRGARVRARASRSTGPHFPRIDTAF